jgi:hypothetical protein
MAWAVAAPLLAVALALAARCGWVAREIAYARQGERLGAAIWQWVLGRYRKERDGRDASRYQERRYDDDRTVAQKG